MVEGSIDVVKGVGTIVVNQRIPSGVDSETLGDQAIATFGVFLSVGTHAVSITGDNAEVVNNPPVAIGGTSLARGESTETDAEVAGFKSRNGGEFHEVMLIRDNDDLKEFMNTYGLEHVDKEYP